MVVAGAVPDHGRAVIMGTPALGQGSGQTIIEHEDGSETKLTVARYYTPDEFAELGGIGLRMGFTHVQASPLTRSSYHAWDQARAAGAGA